jgi:hypothetical protein
LIAPDDHIIAQDAAFRNTTSISDEDSLRNYAVSQRYSLTKAGIVPDYGSLDEAVFSNMAPLPDDRGAFHLHPGIDNAIAADNCRPLQLR